MKRIVFCSKARHINWIISDFDELELELKRFPNNEIIIASKNLFDPNREFFVFQSFVSPNSDIIELALTLDLLRRSKVSDINVVVPYFGYSRQDKTHGFSSSVGFEAVADIILSLGVKEIFSVEIHSQENNKVVNISLVDQYIKHIKNNIDYTNCIIVSPDFGSRHRSENIGKALNIRHCYFEKYRQNDGKLIFSESYTNAIAQNKFNSENCVIVDDMICSGDTIFNVASKLKQLGFKKIFVYCAHFLDSIVDTNNITLVDKIYTTNTCFTEINKDKFPNVELLDIKINLADL